MVSMMVDTIRTKSAPQPALITGPAAKANWGTSHAAGQTEWWFDARGIDAADVRGAVERSNCTHLVLSHAGHRQQQTSKQKVIWIDDVAQLDDLEDGAWVFAPSEEVRAVARARGRKGGTFIDVGDLQRDFGQCLEALERDDDFVVIDIEHATYIPYELLLAKATGKNIRILRSIPIAGLSGKIDTVDQSLNAFATMEHGIGVVFRTANVDAIEDLSRRLSVRQSTRISLVPARVESVQHTGLGHRVCVDATSLMTAEEGMLVGSTGWGGLFVCSETHYLPHMNLREFRVNAGSVHSYVWGPGNKAMYLSEMKAGMDVLCVDTRGNVRSITVGRAKIERRPMLNIRCSVSLDHVPEDVREAIEAVHALQAGVTPEGEQLSAESLRCVYLNVFLQDDWHVRIMGADGRVRHSALVQPGDELLAHVERPGRHTGLSVSEHIVEQ